MSVMGKAEFKERVHDWAEKLGARVTSISLRPMTTKWASYSTTGRLTFDALLLELREELQDYVIAHELLHVHVPNHGKLWKSLMRAYLGEHERLEDELRRVVDKRAGLHRRSRPPTATRASSRRAMKDDRQTIVITGVEGGGITLYGERTQSAWRFSCDFVDQTPFMLADDNDQRKIRRVTKTVESWDEALALVDQQHWLRLDAIWVHPEFRQQVLKAVVERLGADPRNADKLERWRDRCEPSLP